MEIDMEFEKIIDDLYSKYLLTLISYMKNNNIDYKWIERQLPINNINSDISIESESITENQKSRDVLSTENKSTLSTDNLYNKPWTRLNLIHKKLKIKEYVNNLDFINKDEKLTLINELIVLLDSKVLTKKNTINYDENIGKIISIYNLEYKDNKYNYKI